MAANSLWRWRALNTEGEVQTGTLWAIDRGAAYTALVLKQLHPLALKRCQQRHRWQVQHCYDIFRQLATLLQAGLTLSQSLHMLAEQHPLQHWQALLHSLADDLSEGCALSEAMKKWPEVFSPLYVSMVKTGELTGKLEACCRQLAQQQKSQQQLSAKVKKALRYPLIILTLAVSWCWRWSRWFCLSLLQSTKRSTPRSLCSRRQSWGWRPWFRRISSPF